MILFVIVTSLAKGEDDSWDPMHILLLPTLEENGKPRGFILSHYYSDFTIEKLENPSFIRCNLFRYQERLKWLMILIFLGWFKKI
jgi:hypothetical protein